MNLEIVDFEIPQEPKIAKRIQIEIQKLVFNTSATFAVHYFLNNNIFDMHIPKKDYITIEGDEYNAWNNDDDYIINLILNKLGLTKKEPVSVPVEEPLSVPVEEPVSVPVEEPVSVPVEEPVSVPVEEPLSVPVEEPLSVPVEEPVPAEEGAL